MNTRRPWTRPLVPVYGAALAAKDFLRAVGLSRERRLRWPVISIGSVSAGGAGKTPLTIALANLLSARGWRVDVLSRGYRRAGRGVERVDLGIPDPARRFGDEPTLIAQRAAVPVWVGARRFQAGCAAESEAAPGFAAHEPATGTGRLRGAASETRRDTGEFPDWPKAGAPFLEADSLGVSLSPALEVPRVHVLDDGLQHRGLARDFELVAVTAEDLVDSLLPAGNLREPLTALRRAHAVAVREDELPVVERRLRLLLQKDVPLWTVRRTLRFPAPLGVFGAGLRPLAFCALARPEGFAVMLAKAGCGVVDTVMFPDHHRYDGRDTTELIRLAKEMHATGFVITEKDAVKLSPALWQALEKAVGTVMVVALDAAFVYESPVMRLLESRLRPAAAEFAVRHEVRSQ